MRSLERGRGRWVIVRSVLFRIMGDVVGGVLELQLYILGFEILLVHINKIKL